MLSAEEIAASKTVDRFVDEVVEFFKLIFFLNALSSKNKILFTSIILGSKEMFHQQTFFTPQSTMLKRSAWLDTTKSGKICFLWYGLTRGINEYKYIIWKCTDNAEKNCIFVAIWRSQTELHFPFMKHGKTHLLLVPNWPNSFTSCSTLKIANVQPFWERMCLTSHLGFFHILVVELQDEIIQAEEKKGFWVSASTVKEVNDSQVLISNFVFDCCC